MHYSRNVSFLFIQSLYWKQSLVITGTWMRAVLGFRVGKQKAFQRGCLNYTSWHRLCFKNVNIVFPSPPGKELVKWGTGCSPQVRRRKRGREVKKKMWLTEDKDESRLLSDLKWWHLCIMCEVAHPPESTALHACAQFCQVCRPLR